MSKSVPDSALSPQRPDGKKKFPWHTGGDNSALKKWVEKRSGGCVIGGTAWTFSDENIRNLRLDLLVIDEAGQFALASRDYLLSGGYEER